MFLIKHSTEFYDFVKCGFEEQLLTMVCGAEYVVIWKSIIVFLENYLGSLKKYQNNIFNELNQKFITEMEGMRAKKLISGKICEYVYLIK